MVRIMTNDQVPMTKAEGPTAKAAKNAKTESRSGVNTKSTKRK